jgi:hypothetical protein
MYGLALFNLTSSGGNEKFKNKHAPTGFPATGNWKLIEKRQHHTTQILSALLPLVLPSEVAEVCRRRPDGIV